MKRLTDDHIDALLKMSSFTAAQAEVVTGIYGPDVITRLRGRKYLEVWTVGDFRPKRYKLERCDLPA